MDNDLLVLRYASVAGGCSLKDFEGLETKASLHLGRPLAAEWPGDVLFRMDPDFPKDLLLTDSLLNSDQCLVVSARLRAALEALQLVRVEYLPVSIIDHKGRKAPAPYVIVHPVEPVDCIDRDASGVKISRITPGKVSSLKRLVIDASRVPPERTMFRLKDLWGPIVVRKPVADALTRGRFTGVTFIEPAAYPED
jgi:hypothetical protein